MSKIKIVGEDRLYEYDDVENAIIQISDKFFWRDSPELVKVKTSKGVRFRRKKSPLIRKLAYNGQYVDVSDIVTSTSGMELNSADKDVLKVDGDWTIKEFCINIDGIWTLKSKSNMVKGRGGRLIPKDEAVELSKSYGYNEIEYARRDKCLMGVCGGYVHKNDYVNIMNAKTGEIEIHNVRDKKYKSSGFPRTGSVFHKFSEHNSGNLSRITQAAVFQSEYDKNFININDDYDICAHKSIVEDVRELYRVYKENNIRDNTNEIRLRINKTYSDAGPDENNAKEISLDFGTQAGGHVFHRSEAKNIISSSKLKTGGMGYSFGVEFETSAGHLSNRNCSLISVDKIGDRSIGAYEYVTKVLHGSSGIDQVEKICGTLSRKTLVDDKCSIHVHVGGLADKRVESPIFGRKFSIACIKLGAKIEDSLYNMSPPSRNKDLKHVAPVGRWRDISMDKYDNLLGSFLFGGDRNGKISNNDVTGKRYSYKDQSPGYARNSSKWLGSRYKWLNLLNCHTNRGFKTVEIRMWAGSTSFEKVHKYILLSLAIVWFAENRPNLVFNKDDITISDVVSHAYEKKTKIKNMLLEFITDRTERFKEQNQKAK